MNAEDFDYQKALADKPTRSKFIVKDIEDNLEFAVDFSQEPHIVSKITSGRDGKVAWLESKSLLTAFASLSQWLLNAKEDFDKGWTFKYEIVGLYWLKDQEGSCLEVKLFEHNYPEDK